MYVFDAGAAADALFATGDVRRRVEALVRPSLKLDELLDGVPLHLLTDYLQLMAVFALVFVAGGLSLFGALIES